MVARQATLFVDILGFCNLVEREEGAIGLLDGYSHTTSTLREHLNREVLGHQTTLERVFSGFHELFRQNVQHFLRYSRLSSIVFSDSAFVSFDHTSIAFAFAQRLMRHLISAQIPVRMGLGFGSFRALRFSNDVDPNGAISINSVQFLGTSVINAHRAEQCGAGGMRIFIHPDFVIPEELGDEACPIGPSSRPLRVPVTKELNYLIQARDHDDAANKGWELIWTVQDMLAVAPTASKFHYEETLSALWQMREAAGLPILVRNFNKAGE